MRDANICLRGPSGRFPLCIKLCILDSHLPVSGCNIRRGRPGSIPDHCICNLFVYPKRKKKTSARSLCQTLLLWWLARGAATPLFITLKLLNNTHIDLYWCGSGILSVSTLNQNEAANWKVSLAHLTLS